MPVGNLKRAKSMPNIKPSATNGSKNPKIIEYGLNKLKTFKEKNESALLKNLSVPSDSNTELTKKTNKYKENIQKNLHASVSAKLKNIFGMQKSKKEEDRRKILNENVKNFKISLSAYEYFFKKCLGCDAIIKPLLDECDKIYKKLGPKGKGYVEFDESEIENGTDKDLLEISNKYNFEIDDSVEIEYNDGEYKLSFKSLNFSNEKNTSSLTPYKSRAQKVYKGYRDFAEKVSEIVRCELETFKFTLINPTNYKDLLNKIDQTTGIIQTGDSQLKEIKNICDEIEEHKNNALEILGQLNTELKNLKQFCSARYLLFATLTGDDQFNKATETLIAGTGTLINHLSTLRLNLSNGKYDESLKTCELLNGDVGNINTDFESYKTLKKSIDLSRLTSIDKHDKDILNKAEAIRSIKANCDKEIQELESKIKEREKSIKKARKEIIIKILSSISPMLGSILTTINTIASCVGVS